MTTVCSSTPLAWSSRIASIVALAGLASATACRSGDPSDDAPQGGQQGSNVPDHNACEIKIPAPIEREPSEGFLTSDFDTAAPLFAPARPPPPIPGGTLSLSKDGRTAFASDPDRDRMYVVDLLLGIVTADVALMVGDQPWRHVLGPDGKIHVVLRGAGAVATIDPAQARVTERRMVCAEPRGLALDAGKQLLHVACAGGELVSLPLTGPQPVRSIKLDPDLRDVIVDGDRLVVTRLRSSEILVIDHEGKVANRLMPPSRTATFLKGKERIETTIEKSPAVAWRLTAHPNGGAVLLHQRGSDAELAVGPGGYLLDECQGLPVETTLTRLSPGLVDQEGIKAVRPFALLPLLIDVAIAPDASQVAVVTPALRADRPFPSAVVVFDGNELDFGDAQDGCIYARSFVADPKPAMSTTLQAGPNGGLPASDKIYRPAPGQLVAVAIGPSGNVVVQSREPAYVEVITQAVGPVALSTDNRRDTGHDLFHTATGGAIACASCHPEGGEDGRVWKFEGIGQRRTQSLRGGIGDTAPFHWDGDLKDLGHLIKEVYTGRMGGAEVEKMHADALSKWLDGLPNLKASPVEDADALARGAAVFRGKGACRVCHQTPDFTNNINTDVGTGGCFQVPQLNSLAFRAPFMHNGCAATLRDRFSKCGGDDQHGLTSKLSAQELDDLITYLESL